MIRKSRWFGLCFAALALAAGINLTGEAGGGKKNPKAEMNPVDIMVLAAKMEAFGMQTKSPSALLAAGELYWQIVPNSIKEKKDVEIKIEDGKGGKGDPAPETTKIEDPRDKAHAMFKMAQDYAKPGEKAGVDELLKGIKGTLGANNGPHSITRSLNGYQKHSLIVYFTGKQSAHVGFRCAQNLPLDVNVVGSGINTTNYGIFGNVNWFANTAGPVTLHIQNPHKQGVSYTVWVN